MIDANLLTALTPHDGQQYPDHIRHTAIALRLYHNLSYPQIAQHLGVRSHATIINWCNDQDLVHQVVTDNELPDRLKNVLKAKYLRNSMIMADRAIEDDKLDKASTLQLMTSSGIAVDKILSLEGKSPNQINVNILNNQASKLVDQVEDYDSKIMDIEAEIAKLD